MDWKPTKQASSNRRLSAEPPPISEEKLREIMDRESVWVADPEQGFVLGKIVDIGEDGATVEPQDRRKKPVVARYKECRVAKNPNCSDEPLDQSLISPTSEV